MDAMLMQARVGARASHFQKDPQRASSLDPIQVFADIISKPLPTPVRNQAQDPDGGLVAARAKRLMTK
jgi:hypothetical protein